MKTSRSFTLIELMAASTVLSFVLLLMVGMQDQMSRAWSNASRRSDATREANAACRLMAQDFSCLIYRPDNFASQKSAAPCLTNRGVPFLYSSNGTLPNFPITNQQPDSAFLFAVTARKSTSSNREGLACVGYYIASRKWTDVNGFKTTNYNLYRYFAHGTNAANNLDAWFVKRDAMNLFQPNPTNDEVVARNACNLRITTYNRPDGTTEGMPNLVTNGLNYQFIAGGSGNYYSGSKIQVELSVYPDEFARRIPLEKWSLSNNLQKYARSFEFRVDIPRD